MGDHNVLETAVGLDTVLDEYKDCLKWHDEDCAILLMGGLWDPVNGIRDQSTFLKVLELALDGQHVYVTLFLLSTWHKYLTITLTPKAASALVVLATNCNDAEVIHLLLTCLESMVSPQFLQYCFFVAIEYQKNEVSM